MSPEVKRRNRYEDIPSKHTAASVREMAAAVSAKFPDIKYRSVEKKTMIRDNFDQLKRLLDVPDDTVLSEDEYNLAKGLIKNLKETLELPIDARQRQDVDARPIPVILKVHTSTSEVGHTLAATTTEINEPAERSDEALDFSDPKQIEQYDQELLDETKKVFSNQAFFKEHNLTKGLQALGTIRVIFAHWDRALQQIKSNLRNNKEADASLYEQLNKHYDKIQDLIEVVNQAVIDKQTELDGVDSDSENSQIGVEGYVDPALVESPNDQALVEDMTAAPPPETAADVYLLDAIEENISQKTGERIAEIEAALSTLAGVDADSLRDLHNMLEHVRDVKADYDALADGKFYPAEYVRKTKVLTESLRHLAEALEVVTGTQEQNTEISTEAHEPLVLGARERLANDNQFNEVLAKLEGCALDQQDAAFVAVCVENYHKYMDDGDVSKAGSYLHNLEEVLQRKRRQEASGVPHGEIAGRLSIIATSLDAMKVVAPEDAITIGAMLDNVQRLLAEQSTAPEASVHEQKIQQTYQSLETLYRDFTKPDEVPEVVVNEPIIETGSFEVPPTFLPEPAGVTEPEAPPDTSVRFPKVDGVPNPLLRPVEVVEIVGRAKRLRAFWHRLPAVAKAAVIAGLALFANPDTASQQSENFNTASVTKTSILESAWTTGDANEKPAAISAGDGSEAIRISVSPFTPQLIASENPEMMTPVTVPDSVTIFSADPASVTVPETSLQPVVETERLAAVAPTVDLSIPPPNPEMTTTTKADTSAIGEAVSVVSAGGDIVDPKSPAYQETLVPDTTVPKTETRNEAFSVIAKHGEVSTYPDNQLNRLFATVDTSDLPVSLVDRLKAEAKSDFYNDSEALKSAGFSSGQKDVFYDGEVLNYSEPVKDFENSINNHRMYLGVPHTEVVEANENLTTLTLRSYANDLRIIPELDRSSVVENALAKYFVQPSALVDIKVQDKDQIAAGQVVPLSPLARYVAESVSDYVRSKTAAEIPSVEDVAGNNEFNPNTIDEGATMTVETYPGGSLAYSRDYNAQLEALGISPVPPSWTDRFFTAEAGPDSRAILDMTVGELTNIMLSTVPRDVDGALGAEGIKREVANRVYEIIRTARADGAISAKLNDETPISAVLGQNLLLKAQKGT